MPRNEGEEQSKHQGTSSSCCRSAGSFLQTKDNQLFTAKMPTCVEEQLSQWSNAATLWYGEQVKGHDQMISVKCLPTCWFSRI